MTKLIHPRCNILAILILAAVASACAVALRANAGTAASVFAQLGDAIGADIALPMVINPCHDADLSGAPCSARSASLRQLTLGAVIFKPDAVAALGSTRVWRIGLEDICSPGGEAPAIIEPTEGPSDIRLAVRDWDAGLTILGLDRKARIASIEIEVSRTALYSLSSRHRTRLAEAAASRCGAKFGAAGAVHSVVGLVSALVTLRLRLHQPADADRITGLVSAHLGSAFETRNQGQIVVALTPRPVFLGVVLRPLGARN